MSYKLRTIYDIRKSFYDKASVRTEDNKTILTSYSTDVAYIENDIAFVKGSYSMTTLRHIKEFLRQNGYKAETKQQILKDYSNK